MRNLLTIIVGVLTVTSAIAKAETAGTPANDYTITVMPGVNGVGYWPKRAGRDGMMGVGASVGLRTQNRVSDPHEASVTTSYVAAALLQSPGNADSLALFELGSSWGFERNPTRRWLLPYFGGGLGYLVHRRWGNATYAHPIVGLHLVWRPDLVLNIQGGYLLPFRSLDTWRGFRAEATMRLSFW